jgi:hypothetical protein
MLLYAFSPTIATGVNVLMFLVCLVVFRWGYRRQVFFRQMLFDALRGLVASPSSVSGHDLTVFPAEAMGPFRPRDRCTLSRTGSGWLLSRRRILRSPLVMEISDQDCRPVVTVGFLTNSVEIQAEGIHHLTFGRAYNSVLPELAQKMGWQLSDPAESGAAARDGLKAEFA